MSEMLMVFKTNNRTLSIILENKPDIILIVETNINQIHQLKLINFHTYRPDTSLSPSNSRYHGNTVILIH